MPYLGNEPAVAYTSTTKDTFSGDASTTDFTMSKSANVNAVRVVVENVVQNPTVAYTCSGTTISFTSAPPTGTSNIYVVHLGPPAATVAPPTTINNSTTFGDGADIITGSKGTDNVRLGEGAGASIASGGNQNTLIGKDAGTALTTGDNNVAVGHEALKTEDGHGNNVAVGYQSLKVQNAGANAGNTAIGYQSGVAVTDGHSNTLLGAVAGSPLTTGDENTYVGYSAGSSGTATFTGNTALGFNTFAAGTNLGDANTAIGWSVLKNTNANSNGHNTAVGYNAGRGNDSGYDNTFIGSGAGNANSTGYSNTMLGKGSGSLITTGNANTIIGRFDGNQNSLDIRTASNNIVLSDGAGQPRARFDVAGKMTLGVQGGDPFTDLSSSGNILTMGFGSAFGHNAQVFNVGAHTAAYDLIIFRNGNGIVGTIGMNGSATSYATSSDYRLKENVTDISDGITRIKQLAPKRFNFIADADTTVDGFLAHEAATVVPEAITGTKDEVEVWAEAEGDELPDGVSVGDNKLDDDGKTIPVMQGIDQSKLVPLLTAALQEAIAKIETLETKVTALEAG